MKMEKPVKEECRWRVARKIVLVQVQRRWGHMLDQEVSFGGFRGTTFSFLFSLGRYGPYRLLRVIEEGMGCITRHPIYR